MPTYSYACTACGHRFDAQQAFTDASLTECPECSGRLRKLFGAVGVVFKGSGFYRTDSRSSGTTSIPATSSNGSSSATSSSNGASSGGSTSTPSAPSTSTSTPATSAPAASA